MTFLWLIVRSHEPLRVTLDDLHSAESKGKWWLVGAAWAGDPLVDRQDTVVKTEAKKQAVSAESALLKLARKQGMNTDIRRSVFVVLMSSEVRNNYYRSRRASLTSTVIRTMLMHVNGSHSLS